jgi:GH24 family phage-related lysozyme (muramidase)
MIIHHEGKRNKPYRCPALLFTIGVGHVMYPEQAKIPMAERMNFQINPQDDRFYPDEEVFEILRKDLARFVAGVLRLCPETANNQNHLDALVSFSFNVGLGSLQRSQVRQKYNRGDFDGAMDELLTWNKAGGKVLKGLDSRRKDEKALFLS